MVRGSLLLALALLAPACGLNTFDDSVTADTTVQGGGVVGQVLGTFPPMSGFNNFDFSQTQAFKNQNTSKGAVSSVKLKSFTLQITAPNGQDFGFLDSIAFYAEANGTKVRVAHKDNIASLGLKAPNPTLTLDLDDVELKPFVTADTMSLTTTANGRQPVQDTTIHAVADFKVTIGL